MLVVLLVATRAPAETAPAPRLLRYDLRIDLPVTGALLAAVGTLALLASRLTPSCRWCDRSADGRDTLNGLDEAVRGAALAPNPRAAAIAGDTFGYGLAPAVALGFTALAGWHDGQRRQIWIDLMILTEAAAAAEVLDQIAKVSFARERPHAHALYPTDGPSQIADDNVSFYSGHTNFTFALAVASGTIATMRHYRLAGWIWLTGLSLAATTGYLRIAADKHYFTDVLVGALLGSTVGFAVPYLFHRPIRRVTLRPFSQSAPGGGVLGIAGAF
jgi:membrane-associated phospholipid phosphatase